MTSSNPVPADVEPDSIIDLVQDCREISGVLGSFVPTVVRGPEARSPVVVDLPAMTGLAAGLDGYGTYGS